MGIQKLTEHGPRSAWSGGIVILAGLLSWIAFAQVLLTALRAG
jgi:hypothetical protein